MKKKIEIGYELAPREEMPDALQPLFNAAEQALLSSHAPYSQFYVGAALELEDGRIVPGSNQENASFPLGYCAERTALAARVSLAPDAAIRSIAIATLNRTGKTQPPTAPCGLCRQALLEEEVRQGSPIGVYLLGHDHQVLTLSTVRELLPFGFDQSSFRD